MASASAAQTPIDQRPMGVREITDRAGFEPAVPFGGTHAFQASALNHSATCPESKRKGSGAVAAAQCSRMKPATSCYLVAMKIAFIGSHGVGKTTLCFDLAARLKRQDRVVDLVKEVSRACPLPINRETTLAAQAWILHSQIAAEIAMTAEGGIVICDRSVLDNYAYFAHSAGRQPAYDHLVRAWVTSYHALFKVPIIDPPTFDGKRDTSQTFQLAIDEEIDALAAEFGVACHRLDPGNRDGWVDAVLTASGLPLHPPQIDLFRGPSAG